MILITFNYEKRIDGVVKKDMDKLVENVLKLSDTFAIPRKTYKEVVLDEVDIEKNEDELIIQGNHEEYHQIKETKESK